MDALSKVNVEMTQCFWNGRISIFSQYSNHFNIIFPCKRHDPSFEQTLIPLPKGLLYQVWLKVAQWFCRRRILNFANERLQCRFHLPLEKDVALNLKKMWIPFTQWCFMPSLTEMGPVVTAEENENVKRLQTDGRQRIRKAHQVSW